MAALMWNQGRQLETLRIILNQGCINSYSEKFSFKAPYFGLQYAGESGNLIDDHILQYGAFEKSELFLLRDIVGGRRDLVFLDIEANTGGYSLFMAPLVAKVHAVEPFPPVLVKLRYNVALNQLGNVAIHPVGFGKERGSLPFYAPPDFNRGIGTFSGEFAEKSARDDRSSGVEQLPLERGDSYLQQQGVERVDIVKVDIEGYEKLALQGLSEILGKSRPYVLMELNIVNSEGFHSFEELQGVFPQRYSLYEVRRSSADLRDGGYSLKPLSALPERQCNVLAVPEERRVPK